MWLTCSSIGRKFVMALTGICLVLFVTFHCVMNAVALLWPASYNAICQFLGANWYALVASAGLAALFIIHIIYATWLTIQNRKARGADRYAVNSRPPQVEWSSKNMLVLGIVILAFLVVHLIQFWSKMQLQELLHDELSVLPIIQGMPADPQLGTLFIQAAFSQIWTPIVYIVGFVALWFHLNHGFWSMFHSVGLDNNIWIERWKKIGCWWTSIVVALFIAQAIVFTVKAKSVDDNYINDPTLKEQYVEALNKAVEPVINEYNEALGSAYQQATYGNDAPLRAFVNANGDAITNALTPIVDAANTINASSEKIGWAGFVLQLIEQVKSTMQATAPAQPALGDMNIDVAGGEPEETPENAN